MSVPCPRRKPNRLPNFDYSSNHAYFVTICTQDRKNTLCSIVGDGFPVPKPYGSIAASWIPAITEKYPQVHVDQFVVMPNHIHLLLQIQTDADGRAMPAPTISTVINELKGAISNKAGFPLWQKGFHDHVIRGERDYREVWNYIEGNPAKWLEDTLCAPE